MCLPSTVTEDLMSITKKERENDSDLGHHLYKLGISDALEEQFNPLINTEVFWRGSEKRFRGIR